MRKVTPGTCSELLASLKFEIYFKNQFKVWPTFYKEFVTTPNTSRYKHKFSPSGAANEILFTMNIDLDLKGGIL